MFIDTQPFPFIQLLEANWKSILDEFLRIPEDDLLPYPEVDLYKEDWKLGWKLFGLYMFGDKITHNAQHCPITTALVERIPEMKSVSFSRLSAATHIKPHEGYKDPVFRCHLGLITPSGCTLRVGNETLSWEEGRCFIFDDAVVHEAWNRSDQDRVVLMVDFTKPGATYSVPERHSHLKEDMMRMSRIHSTRMQKLSRANPQS
jgi:beta-hydroxylase